MRVRQFCKEVVIDVVTWYSSLCLSCSSTTSVCGCLAWSPFSYPLFCASLKLKHIFTDIPLTRMNHKVPPNNKGVQKCRRTHEIIIEPYCVCPAGNGKSRRLAMKLLQYSQSCCLDKDGSNSGDSEKWSNTEYILKIRQRKYAEWQGMRHKRHRSHR